MFFVFIVLPSVFCLLSSTLRAQSALPLDEKARYEKSLEVKVEEVLLKLLGPNQAKVVVQASMDFTRTETLDVTSGSGTEADKNKTFKWQTASAETQPFNDYLLPGFPSPELSGSDAKSYQKKMLFPTAFVKKLIVSVIVNKNMTEPEIQSVRTVVAEVLGLDMARGDELSIIKTPFAPFWKTIWYTPEALNLVFKYGILTIMGIVAMIVVSVGFLKLAGAMNTMAKAQQSHQITMDLGNKGGAGGPGVPGMPGLPGGLPLGLPGFEKTESGGGKEEGGGDEAQQEVIFSVRPDQVDFLVILMGGEDPANVALVTSHLESSVRTEFLKKLPPEMSSEVISHMASVRFVDADVVNTIKEELEKRLGSAVGGVGKVIAALDKVSLKAKKAMLERLGKRHPEIAAQVRAQVLLPVDLERLSEKDMSLLISNFKVETLASAIWEFEETTKDKIKKQMADKTWLMVEQTMKYGAPSRESSENAAEELIAAASKLIKEGRIANPLEDVSRAPSNPEAPPVAGPPTRKLFKGCCPSRLGWTRQRFQEKNMEKTLFSQLSRRFRPAPAPAGRFGSGSSGP